MQNAKAPLSRSTADLIYESFYSGALGGSLVALFFLLVDSLKGQPFYTPSLMGSVLFAGSDVASVTGVQLDMVAYYSVVHFAVFGIIGAAVCFLVHEVELHARHPAEVLVLLFLVLEGGFFVGTSLAMPGVMAQLGAFRVAVANLLAAVGMGLFLLAQHSPERWQRIKQFAHIG